MSGHDAYLLEDLATRVCSHMDDLIDLMTTENHGYVLPWTRDLFIEIWDEVILRYRLEEGFEITLSIHHDSLSNDISLACDIFLSMCQTANDRYQVGTFDKPPMGRLYPHMRYSR